MPSIPKKIHFIWIGGILPDQYLTSIIKLAQIAKKSGFEFCLWVDNDNNFYQAFENRIKKNRHGYFDISEDCIQKSGIKIRKINDLLENMKQDTFYLTENL